MQRQHFLALALAAAGLLTFNSPAKAQTGDQPPTSATADSGHRMLDPVGRLLEKRSELKITDDQASRLEAIRAKARSALRASMDSTRTEVMAVLTPEQHKQVAEMRKQWRGEWRDGRHKGRHGERHGHDHDDDDDDSKANH
jgi:Spy/CpxP family protein refolding chaperone